MSKKLSLIVWAALAALVSSCHKESDERIVWSNNEVRFSTQILSRAVNGQWESEDEVGIYMFASNTDLSDESVFDRSSNNKYLVSANGALSSATEMDKLYYPKSGTVDFIAYYPFDNVENYSVDIDVSNQTRPEEIDFLYSNNVTGVAATNETQSLQFNHLMSKLIFNVNAGTGVDAGALEGLTVKVYNAVTNGTVSLVDGTVTPGEEKNDITTRSVSSSSSTTTTTESSVQTEAIVVPQECNDLLIAVSLVSGQKYLYQLASGDKWISGTEYSYEINLEAPATNASLSATINNWTTVDAGEVEQFNVQPWDGTTIDKKWYSPDLSTLTICQPSELAGLAELVNSGISFEGKTIYLSNDLDMNQKAWKSIGFASDTPFKGTFLGNNHLIKNVNPSFVDNSNVAGVFGVSYGTIQQLVVSGSYNLDYDKGTSSYVYVGGICAINEGVVSQCRSYAEIDANLTKTTTEMIQVYAGGVVAQNNKELSNCQNYGTISVDNINTTSNSYIHVGGIAGSNTGTLTHCENTRNVTGRNGNVRIGGIVAISSGTDVYVGNCSNSGDIFITTSHHEAIAGGVVGKNASKATVTAVYNKGNIEASLESGLKICGGGIIGMNDGANLIAGENSGDVTVSVANNGEEECVAAAGGGVGYNTNGAEVHQAINNGTVLANSADVCYSGGITGYNDISENKVAYTYACGLNSGYPLQWVGNATDEDDLVTEEEAGAHDNE